MFYLWTDDKWTNINNDKIHSTFGFTLRKRGKFLSNLAVRKKNMESLFHFLFEIYYRLIETSKCWYIEATADLNSSGVTMMCKELIDPAPPLFIRIFVYYGKKLSQYHTLERLCLCIWLYCYNITGRLFISQHVMTSIEDFLETFINDWTTL